MWDWELLKHNSGKYKHHVISSYKTEDCQFTKAISAGSPEDEFILHNHSVYEIQIYTCGDVVYMVDGVLYDIEPGSLLMIAPTVPHKMLIRSDTTFERYVFYISHAGNQSVFNKLAQECLPIIDSKKTGSIYYAPDQVKSLIPLLEEINDCALSEQKRINELVPVFVQAMLAELVMLSEKQRPAYSTLGIDRKMDAVKDYLIRHISEELTLQGIAEHFHLSKDYCNRLFHKETGMSIMQFVKYSRVLIARQLLADGVPAAEAATRAGFADYSSFYRSYRLITGRAPSEDYQIASSDPAFLPTVDPEKEE